MIDDELLSQCQSGSQSAFRTLYYRVMPRVRVWVARLMGPTASVADVVQDVFVQVHRSIGAFRGEAAFGTWLYRLTLNVVTTHLRRNGRDVPLRAPTDEPSYDEGGRLAAREDLRRMYQALDALPIEKRVVFVLFELEGLSLREIAEIIGTGVPTAAARLRRARKALVEGFGQRGAAGRRIGAGAGPVEE